MSVLEILEQASSTAYVTVDLVGKPLAAALGLSLVVERVVELLKNGLDLLPTPGGVRRVEPLKAVESACKDLADFHDQAAGRQKDEQEEEKLAPQRESAYAKIADVRARLAATTGAEQERLKAELEEMQKLLPTSLNVSEVQEHYPHKTILVKPAIDPDDGSTLRAFILQAVALAVGIVAARLAQVQLFTPLFQSLGEGGSQLLRGGYATDYILTGLLIGGGSAPVHMLIRFLGARTMPAPPPPVATEPARSTPAAAVGAGAVAVVPVAEVASEEGRGGGTAVSAPAVVLARTGMEYVDLPYEGGVTPDKLEGVHRRSGKPNLIVFHHTAMPLSSTFSDVVRVIHDRKDAKERPWITGYHCVVTGDGVAHPFCRWDRYGNHAQGYNDRSLGLALNGNFETDPGVPYSNARGDYGPARPTAPQLESAARVVALWCYIYGIPVEFGRTIRPHRDVSPKTCPGNNFPYADFERLVKDFYEAWAVPATKERIRAFAQRPYISVA